MPAKNLNILHQPAKGRNNQKPPIIFVHGSWHGAWCWQTHFVDYFSRHGFNVYAPDLRGHGDSPPQKAMRWNRIAEYVDDVLYVVDSLDQKPVLIGHSMGGFISQHCMLRCDKLAAVGLLATVPYYGVLPVAAKIAVLRPIDFAKANLFWTLYPLVKDPLKAWHMFLESNIPREEAFEFAARLCDESYLGFLDMMFLDLPKKPVTHPPVMVIGGEKDTLFSVPSQEATARRYNASCHIIARAPHNLMVASQWRETADKILEWIEGLPDND
ncbi:MAG: lysophospholipase [Rhizobiaceae bacterium]|nr:lysophospholipase [Rhizobiaceae bacterium]